MKLKHSLDTFYAIWPGNAWGLLYPYYKLLNTFTHIHPDTQIIQHCYGLFQLNLLRPVVHLMYLLHLFQTCASFWTDKTFHTLLNTIPPSLPWTFSSVYFHLPPQVETLSIYTALCHQLYCETLLVYLSSDRIHTKTF